MSPLERLLPQAPRALCRMLDPAAGTVAPPVRSEVFGPERFAQHGRSLGETHTAAPARLPGAGFFPRLRLALLSMVATVALVTAAGVWLLGLPLGVAVLLGGILAPTDPVLATDVQVDSPTDRDQLRFALTGEGGLNDGTAFPVVMLGLGLVGAHEIGAWGWRWLAVDVLWATGAGVAIGAVLGGLLGKLVLYLRRTHQVAVGYENFLALGLIGLAYGIAVMAQAYGFLAVFAAGLALRHTARVATEAAAVALLVSSDPRCARVLSGYRSCER